MEWQTSTTKIDLEDNIKCTIPTHHAILTWLVHRAANVVTKVEVKRSGKTSYEILKGVLCRGGDLQLRWGDGTWLGKESKSDEHVIAANCNRVTHSWAIKLFPEDQ